MVAIAAAFLLFLFMFVGKKHVLQKYQGVLFVLIYASYTAFLVLSA